MKGTMSSTLRISTLVIYKTWHNESLSKVKIKTCFSFKINSLFRKVFASAFAYHCLFK